MAIRARRQRGPALCACGCGQPTKIAPHSDKVSGAVKGQPRKFVRGHQRRGDFRTFVKEGDRSGKLTALTDAAGAKAIVFCLCDCGNTYSTTAYQIHRKRTRSCGCLLRETSHLVHGCAIRGHEHPLYRVWAGMLGRCYNPENTKYLLYGARGITVCERWRSSFANFLHDMSPRPSGTTLDRRDNDQGYSLSNCRWATPTVQARNRRSNRIVDVFGSKMTFAAAVERYAVVPLSTVESRLNRLGWGIIDALSIPAGMKR